MLCCIFCVLTFFFPSETFLQKGVQLDRVQSAVQGNKNTEVTLRFRVILLSNLALEKTTLAPMSITYLFTWDGSNYVTIKRQLNFIKFRFFFLSILELGSIYVLTST